MKLNTPLPQPLPKECEKAAKIFRSFVDGSNNGLDGVIPRNILENARGFAVFTVFKAGFVFSARAGSGVVIAKLQDGSWSAPSAIGTAGLGFGGQAGAEMTDFLVVLNSHSAVRSFMSAGSVTLGGNLSIAVGPLGRNGEASGSLNTHGKLAAMYSYSKTRGLFGGVSLEGSVIMERQDANSQAYHSDVTARMLLSGSVDVPDWAQPLIRTLEDCTGLPGGRKWVQELDSRRDTGYYFNGASSPRPESASGSSTLKKKERPGFFRRASSSSFFDFRDRSQDNLSGDVDNTGSSKKSPTLQESSHSENSTSSYFDTQFESDFVPEAESWKHPNISPSPYRTDPTDNDFQEGSPFNTLQSRPMANWPHRRTFSAYAPRQSTSSPSNLFASSTQNRRASLDYIEDLDGRPPANYDQRTRTPKIQPKAELTKPLNPGEGVARAIALYDFNAVQDGDLSFSKGQVITVKYMSNSTDSWWLGRINGREGIFPANFVEVV